MTDDDLPMMPHFPREFLGETLGWRLIEREVYRSLLDAQWNMRSLPNDQSELIEIARARPAEFRAAWPRVSRKFQVDQSGRLFNAALETKRQVALALRDKHRNAGRVGGLASAAARASKRDERSFNDRPTIVRANGQAESNPPSPSPSPSPSPGSESLAHSASDFDSTVGAQTSSRAGVRRAGDTGEQRGRRCPEPFLISDDMRAWAQREAPHVDLNEATAEFVDYWRGVPGQRGRKVDWTSTWRNRMREREARAKLNGNGRTNGIVTKYDRIKQALDDG